MTNEEIESTLKTLRERRDRITLAIEAFEVMEQHPVTRSNRGRKSMGVEERQVVSDRMRKYWAGRRNDRTS